MIYLYSGTPGSGKSYHAIVDILAKVRRKKKNRVIANFPVRVDSAYTNRFEYWDNSDITISALRDYALKHHARGVEGQTLVVIDEAQCIFNSRDWNGRGILHSALKKQPDSRMDWIKFFSQHRKFGYNVILIAQNDKMLDKQIRALIEYDVKHVKMNNGFFFFLPTSFLAIDKWYGQNMKLSSQVIWYHKKVAERYDSYAMFDSMADTAPPSEGGGTDVFEIGGVELAESAKQHASIGRSSVQILQDTANENSCQDLAQHFGPDAEIMPAKQKKRTLLQLLRGCGRILKREIRRCCQKRK